MALPLKRAQIPFRIGYYTLSLPEALEVRFSELLEDCKAAHDVGRQSDLVCVSGPHEYWMHAISGGVELYNGNLALSDRQLTASRARAGESIEPIELQDEEGIAHEAAFAYAPAHNLVVLQKNATGVTPSRFCWYISRLMQVSEGKVELVPVARKDTYERFTHKDKYRKLTMKVATPAGSAFEDAPGELGDVIRMAQRTGSAAIRVEMLMGYERERDLDSGYVRRFVNYLRERPEVIELRITGRAEDEGRSEQINLLDDFLEDVIKITPDENRSIPYVYRQGILNDSLANNRRVLHQILGHAP